MPTDPALISGRLNVNDFVAARTEDIKKLEKLISSSGTGSKKRAFQSVPRTERRRAASHDSKRVPKKRGLRKLAEYENVRDNSKKPKVHKRSPPTSSAQPLKDHFTINKLSEFPQGRPGLKYANRQKDKIWLPTHIWHKKRAFMKQVGEFIIPITATQKQYRRAHRSGFHLDENSGIAWDTSYLGTMTIKGDENLLKSHIAQYAKDAAQPVYLNGYKVWEGFWHEELPVILHWIKSDNVSIQCHPDSFGVIFNSLEHIKSELEIHDLRFALGSIDLMGAQALKVLTETALLASDNKELNDEWSRLGTGQTTNILPSNTVFKLGLKDPRIHSYFYKGHQTGLTADSINRMVKLIREGESEFPSVYNHEDRQLSLASQLTQSEVDLKAKPDTSVVPACIYTLKDGRLRVVLPKDWILPFWLMIFKRRRLLVGGLREIHQLSFESGKPFYPIDFPLSTGGIEYHRSLAIKNQEEYERKPKSKRVSFKRDLGNPFSHVDLNLLKHDNDTMDDMNDSPGFHQVIITAIGRGVPQPGARIFVLPAKLEDKLQGMQDSKETRFEETMDIADLIGFVTTGSFTYNLAKGSGIGICKSRGPTKCLVKNLGNDRVFLANITPVN